MREHGFVLAKGDRRGFVAVDTNGKVWSLSRWCGVKPRELRARLGSEENLPSVEEVLAQIPISAVPEGDKSKETVSGDTEVVESPSFAFRRSELIARQREERQLLLESQEARRIASLKARKTQLPKGLRAAFLRVAGRYKVLLRDFETETHRLASIDREEQQALVDRHLQERRALERDARIHSTAKDFRESLHSAFAPDPEQIFEPGVEAPLFSLRELTANPELVLAHISKTKARFERSDVLTELAWHVDDPFVLKELADRALQSPQLIKLEDGARPQFTTRDYQDTEIRLHAHAAVMAETGGYGVAARHVTDAIARQNRRMNRAFGGRLSDEQQHALKHILSDKQLTCVVGLAGSGKSTLLATAMNAWAQQGLTVHGAALAGKAADGLESASGIKSRTLASLETSWANGYAPIERGDVLVIDEAGMIGTRQLERVLTKVNEIGAKLVLVGDPDQLQPIEAGTPFRALMKSHRHAKLSEIHRQRRDWQRQASRDLAEGSIGEALSVYHKHKAIKQHVTQDEAIEALVEAYAMDVAADKQTNRTRLAFAHRRKDVHALNQAIRTALREQTDAHQRQEDVLLQIDTGKRAFVAGDRLVFSRNDKDMGVKNGMLGTVTSVTEEAVTVELDGEDQKQITFNPNQYRSFDHGYAVTIHKSQGATVDQAYVLASRSMDRHLAYVAMTRHRDNMQLHISEKDKPRWMKLQTAKRVVRAQQSHKGPSLD